MLACPSVGDFIYFPQTQSLFHLFNNMCENIREPAFDIAKYWFIGSVSINAKMGGSYINRDRGFISRRFRFLPRGNATQVIDTSPLPEQLLASENINPINGFEIREETRPTDEYTALHNITAGYGMGDVTLRRWRFIGGARVEKSVQRVNTLEPFNPNAVPVQAELENTDWLPSLGLVYAIKKRITDVGALSLRGFIFFNNGNAQTTPENFNGNTATMIAAKGVKIVQGDPLLKVPFSKTAPDFRPNAGSPALNEANVEPPPAGDSFFVATNYVGAFDANTDWTLGWTKFVFGM